MSTRKTPDSGEVPEHDGHDGHDGHGHHGDHDDHGGALATEGGSPVAFIDSIEEGVAQLIQRSAGREIRQFTLPAALLPADAREGCWVELPIRVIPAPAGDDPEDLRRRLGAKDDGGDFSL